MKIVMRKQPRQTIEDFADEYDLIMEVTERRPELCGFENYNKHYACFQSAEIAAGGILQGAHGNGATPEAAIRDYKRNIAGRTLVVDAMKLSRREIQVPILVTISCPSCSDRRCSCQCPDCLTVRVVVDEDK